MTEPYIVQGDKEPLLITNAVVTGLSLMGEAFALWAFLWKRNVQDDYRFKLVMGLIACSFLTSAANILSLINNSNPYMCQADGFLRYFGEISSVVFIIAISDVSCKKIQYPRLNPEEHFKQSVLLAIGLGLVMGIIPIFGTVSGLYEGYEEVFLWCADPNTWVEIVLVTGITACLVVLLVEYAMMMKAIKRLSVVSDEDLQMNTNRIMLYPFIFILSWIPGIVNTIFGLLDMPYNYVLTMGQIIGIHSLGFTNGLYFGLSRMSTVNYEIEKESLFGCNEDLNASVIENRFDELGSSIIIDKNDHYFHDL